MIARPDQNTTIATHDEIDDDDYYADVEVWYQTPDTWRAAGGGLTAVEIDEWNLEATHTRLAVIEYSARVLSLGTMGILSATMRAMQGEVWSPMGEAREAVLSAGLQHTSMSPGDVIVLRSNSDVADDEVYVVRANGFTRIEGRASIRAYNF